MPRFEADKQYSIMITLRDTAEVMDMTVSGDEVERGIETAKAEHPAFKRIIVYDEETKDAVALIRN